MSIGFIIQNIQDTQLIRIFLEFAQKYSLKYEKAVQQISYKCFQGCWLICSLKGLGYGRTQNQAYKNALRNLFQLLIEQQRYRIHFEKVFNKFSEKKYKTDMNDKQNADKIKGDISKSSKNVKSHNSFMLNNRQKIIQAKQKYKQILKQLNFVLSENQNLKRQITYIENKKMLIKQDSPKKMKNINKISLQDVDLKKIEIPKLKLDVLPSYHKKSQKSLNEHLLALYNQNHGVNHSFNQ